MADPSFHTPRLIAKPHTLDDAAAFHAVANDFDVVKMTGTFPWPLTREYAQERIGKMLAMDPDREQVFGLFLGDTLIGSIGLHDPKHTGAYTLGYLIGKQWWGSGYASEAVIGIVAWSKKTWSDEITIIADHYTDNPASGRVLEKAGFTFTGKTHLTHCASRQQNLPSKQYIFCAI